MMRPYYQYDRDAEYRREYRGASYVLGVPLTPAVKWILLANLVVFVLQLALAARGGLAHDRFMALFAFTPELAVEHMWLWQFVTYMFLHGGVWHIALNMLFLWMVGGIAEGDLGTRRFVWLYFSAGVAGAAAQAFVFYGASTVGASAAVMGAAAAVATLHPDMRVLFFFIIPMRMKHFLWILVVIQILGANATGGGGSVAYFAHLAGLAAGYFFVRWHKGASLVAWKWRMRGSRLWDRAKALVLRRPPRAVQIDDEEDYKAEVDRLLDKIFREGTQSLTRDENDFLKRTSERYKH